MAGGGDQNDDMFQALARKLRQVPPERTAVLCVGNRARGDDGFGPAVAERLRGRLQAPLFDCGVSPENDLPRAAALDPQAVIVVDAVHFEAQPGEVRLLAVDSLRAGGVSTHAPSLSVAAEFLRHACQARVLVLAAQPEQLRPEEGLSAAMEDAVARAASILLRLLGA